jgi:galactose-1-phosphate uridylyltransferase
MEEESAMRIPELVLDKLRDLPPDKQRAVLEFVESLQQYGAAAKPLKGFEGLLEKYNVQITEEDIAEARREMWGNFPRDVS